MKHRSASKQRSMSPAPSRDSQSRRALVRAGVGLAIAAPMLALMGASPASAATVAGPTSDYIVQLAPTGSLTAVDGELRSRGVQVKRTFSRAVRAMVVRLSATEAAALARDPRVASVEADSVVRTSATQVNPTWGLDRIDQRVLPLSASYTYTDPAANVRAYVIDTGILPTANDLAGRVASGYSAIADANGSVDCNGHGTHVAGTIAGTVYGVAKAATVVPVRVLDCTGSGTISGVIAGIDWAVADHLPGVPAVANLSLGGGASATLDAAIDRLVADGVTVAVAAGNSNANACNSSPARAASAITVGATSNTDARASFSNFGTCLDVFAPGVNITSSWYTSPTATATISGTSMASPHVAGAAALILATQPTLTPAQVTALITSTATTNVVTSPGTGSPNRLLYTGDPNVAQPPAPVITAPAAPTNVRATSPSRGTANVTWTQGSNGGAVLISQTVRVYRVSTGALILTGNVSATATSVRVTGLTSGVAYQFTVSATNSAGTSPESARSASLTVR